MKGISIRDEILSAPLTFKQANASANNEQYTSTRSAIILMFSAARADGSSTLASNFEDNAADLYWPATSSVAATETQTPRFRIMANWRGIIVFPSLFFL